MVWQSLAMGLPVPFDVMLSSYAKAWLIEHELYEPKPSSELQPLDEEGIKRFNERWAHLPKAELTPDQQASLDAADQRRRDGTGRYLTHEEVMRMHSLRRLLAKVRNDALEEAATYCEQNPYIKDGARPDNIRALKVSDA